jgi:hypothetical protein
MHHRRGRLAGYRGPGEQQNWCIRPPRARAAWWGRCCSRWSCAVGSGRHTGGRRAVRDRQRAGELRSGRRRNGRRCRPTSSCSPSPSRSGPTTCSRAGHLRYRIAEHRHPRGRQRSHRGHRRGAHPFPRGACTVSWLLRDGLGETIDQGLIAFSVQTDPAADDRRDRPDDEADDATGSRGTAGAADAARPPTEVTDEGSSAWGAVARSCDLDHRHPGAVRRAGADRHGVARGPEYVITLRFVRSLWLVASWAPCCSCGVHRRGVRPGVRRLAQSHGVARPRRRRMAGSGGARPSAARGRDRVGRVPARARDRSDHAVAGVRDPGARGGGGRLGAHRAATRPDRCVLGRPRAGGGGVVRRGAAGGPGGGGRVRARTTSCTPCAGSTGCRRPRSPSPS